VDIIQQLNVGDFLPVTLYIYNQGFLYNRDPFELESYLNRILELADGTPIAFAEIGWSTAESLEGTQEDQEIFIREAFRLLKQHRDNIEFLAWFDLHDSKLDISYEAALSFLPDNSYLIQDETFMIAFVDFLNYHGLRENDGTPKLGWTAFQEESSLYLDSMP
ncbi:MAG: hypothetical protein HQ574_08860, partial [Chloroflexi bacterium]|nr:hypothetical protein [Chloroflexota bacterium]